MFALGVYVPTASAQSDRSEDPNDRGAVLTSEDVSDEELQAVAEVVVTLQMHRQTMHKQMREEYGNPQKMDSTQRRNARMEMMEKQEEMVQKTMEEENITDEQIGLIMTSAQKDSTLRARVRAAVQKKRQAIMEEARE